MSKQIEALKLALEALKELRMLGMNMQWHDSWLAKSETAITAIREALAEQPAQQEPVAVYVGETWCGSVVSLYVDLPLETPLYTSPPASKPWVGLTDEEIWKFWWSRPEVPDGEDDSMEAEFVAAVRRVLAAHGIGGES